MNVIERLAALRQNMKEHGIQALVIPTSDYHDTEYVCEHFAARKYYSGFTGSAGTLVVLADKAALWTDGRYFIQAAHQLEGSGIELMKTGQPKTPTMAAWITENLKAGDKAAVDGRCISRAEWASLKESLEKADIQLETGLDLAGNSWKDRPALPSTETFHYDEKYTGKSAAEKLSDVRKAMAKAGADAYLTQKIDDIAWLYNLRAHDIPNFPVALAYTIVTPDGGMLYIDDSRLDTVSRKELEENGIEVRPYDAVYADAAALEGAVMMDPALTNAAFAQAVKNPLWLTDPVVLMKAMKNEVELAGAREAHLKDGAAVIRFWKWLEEELPKGGVTEISAADKLQQFRKEQPDYLEDSFETISAYAGNAAMAHYHADADHPVEIEPKGLYLVDSGGHYLQGTTDITRTFVAGPLTEQEKHDFTRVLQGHIDLARAHFLHGTRGMNLDILARGWLWNENMDFNHGTGHGVGALSNVHEAPNGIRWKIVPERNDSAVLEVGMITSNEPGIYKEDQYGIRHENLMAVVPAGSSEYGDFLKHEILTMVPFDVTGLDLSLMNENQIDWLNQYHQEVYDKIAPRLNEEERQWLAKKTAPVSK